MDCIFCQIANKKTKTDFLFENDQLIVFRDIKPSAPIHLLIVPKQHIRSIREIEEKHKELIGQMFLTAKDMAQKEGVAKSGYKLIFNVGRGGGQIIDHLHLHLLGGKKFKE